MISIVQLTHNNRGQVLDCLPTVARLAARPEVAEWIVLDNASTDGTADELEQMATRWPKLQIIRSSENLGCGGGRNVIWREARGRLVLSMDSDVYVEEPEALPRMLADLERHGVAIVGEHGGWIRQNWSWTVEATGDYVGPVPIVCGFCQLFRRQLVDAWVQRPEYGPYWLDDSEFSLQVGAAGWIARYGMRHAWSKTNSQGNRARRLAWSAFRARWRRSGLDVHEPAGIRDVRPVRPARRRIRR